MAPNYLFLSVYIVFAFILTDTKALFENCNTSANCTQDGTFCNGTQCVCQENTHYVFSNSDCYQYCPELTDPTNGTVSADNRTFEATATYTCNSGYVISGTNDEEQLNATCGSNGTWTPGSASCVKRDCGEPPALVNGGVVRTSTTFEAKATYTCNTGYIITDTDSATLLIQCTAAGTWNVTNPTCSVIAHKLGETCPDPDTTGLQPGQLCTRTNALCLVSTGSEFRCQCDSMFYDDNGAAGGGTCKSVAELKVTNVTFSSVSTTSMFVSWTPPNGKEAFVNGYQVEWMGKSNPSQTGSSEILLSNIVQFSISSDVDSGRAYKVKVITWNGVSYSPIRKSTSVEKEQVLKPQRPGPIISESSDLDAQDKSIDVTWTANGYASQYEIALLEGDTVLNLTKSNTNSAVIALAEFKNGHRYNIAITAISEEFDGGQVIKSEIFTKEIKTKVKEPSPPRAVECKTTTDTTVAIQWMVPEMPNGDLVEYIVYTYLLDEDQPVKTNHTNSTALMFEVTGLMPGSYYVFNVSAVNEQFTSMPAKLLDQFCATRLNTPLKPTNVQILDITATSCRVTWDIGDPRPGNTTFEVIITATTPVEEKRYILIGFDKRTQALGGLEEYWNYTVIVTAMTSVGSMVSDPTTFTTLPAAPGPVDNFTIVPHPDGNFNVILVHWKLPTLLERNGEIVRFTLQYKTSLHMNVAIIEQIRLTDPDHLYEVRLGVVPEVTYQFTIFAVNKDNQTGLKNVTTITIPAQHEEPETVTTVVTVGPDTSTIVAAVIVSVVVLIAAIVVAVIIMLKKRRDLPRITESFSDFESTLATLHNDNNLPLSSNYEDLQQTSSANPQPVNMSPPPDDHVYQELSHYENA